MIILWIAKWAQSEDHISLFSLIECVTNKIITLFGLLILLTPGGEDGIKKIYKYINDFEHSPAVWAFLFSLPFFSIYHLLIQRIYPTVEQNK